MVRNSKKEEKINFDDEEIPEGKKRILLLCASATKKYYRFLIDPWETDTVHKLAFESSKYNPFDLQIVKVFLCSKAEDAVARATNKMKNFLNTKKNDGLKSGIWFTESREYIIETMNKVIKDIEGSAVNYSSAEE